MRSGTHTNTRNCTARRIMLLSGLVGGLAVAGCTGTDTGPDSPNGPRAMRPIEPYHSGDRYVSEMMSVGPDNRRTGEGPVLVGRESLGVSMSDERSRGGGSGLMETNPGELMTLKYSANKVNAQDVLRALIGEYLGRDFVIDPAINDQITMDIDTEMTSGDVVDLLGVLSMLHGWAITDEAGVLVVSKTTGADMARETNTPLRRARSMMDTDGVAMRVRRLRYLSAGDVKPLLDPILSTGAVQVPVGQMLVLIDTERQLNRASDVLSAVDVPEFDGVEILTYRLSDRSPKEAQALLESLMQGAGLRGRGQPLAAFIAVEGSDRLIVILRDPSVLPKLNTLIEQVDSPRNENSRYRFAYRIQHYPGTELQSLINSFFESRIVSGGAEELQVDSDKMKLVWDQAGELLLVQATMADYQDLLEVLRVVDRPRQQVTIEAVIAEVTLNDTLRYGVEYFLEETIGDVGELELLGNPGLLSDPTGSAFFVGSSGVAIVQALQSQSTVNIVSQPKITVLNGSEAKFQVGGSVPVVQADVDTDTTVDGNTGIRRNIEYRDTGVILEVTPRINESGMVELTILQEITDVGAANDLGPTFTTRVLRTKAIVPHGKTIVLGGFIESRTNEETSKVPLLGDFPLIGPAFQSVNDVEDRTEIILTLTPRVMSDPNQAPQTVDGFLEAAWAVRAALVSREDELPSGMLRRSGASDGRVGQEIFTAVPRMFINGDEDEVPLPREPESRAAPDAEAVEPAEPVELPPILRQMLESIEDEKKNDRSSMRRLVPGWQFGRIATVTLARWFDGSASREG